MRGRAARAPRAGRLVRRREARRRCAAARTEARRRRYARARAEHGRAQPDRHEPAASDRLLDVRVLRTRIRARARRKPLPARSVHAGHLSRRLRAAQPSRRRSAHARRARVQHADRVGPAAIAPRAPRARRRAVREPGRARRLPADDAGRRDVQRHHVFDGRARHAAARVHELHRAAPHARMDHAGDDRAGAVDRAVGPQVRIAATDLDVARTRGERAHAVRAGTAARHRRRCVRQGNRPAPRHQRAQRRLSPAQAAQALRRREPDSAHVPDVEARADLTRGGGAAPGRRRFLADDRRYFSSVICTTFTITSPTAITR